jgi:hypothetical protein
MTDDDRIAYLTGDTRVPLSRAERAELDELRDLLAEPALWIEPDPALQERIVDAITGAAATGPLHPAAAFDPLNVAGGSTGRRSRRLTYLIIGVAAAVLLAVGVGIGVTSHHSRPVQFAASLTGTDLAPRAFGGVSLTQTADGWKIHLRASGLARLDNGRYYEAWLKSTAGVLVPVGTFNQPTDVTLWAGVAPSSYPTLTVTRQQANGRQASSGQVVLIGTTHPSG